MFMISLAFAVCVFLSVFLCFCVYLFVGLCACVFATILAFIEYACQFVCGFDQLSLRLVCVFECVCV